MMRKIITPGNNLHHLDLTLNYTKGYVKELLLYLHDQMTDLPYLQQINTLLEQIYDLSHRDKRHDPLYFFTRRQKAQVAKFLLDEGRDQGEIPDDVYQTIKKSLTPIFFENFSQQLLPATTGIIPSQNHKKEAYINPHKILEREVLEPREYIGIVPEAYSDLDAPSLVTALTPAHYEQPWHDHGENWEITFYTGISYGKYQTQGQEYSIEAQFGDVIIFPPKTRHTIQNPTDHAVMNLSIKLPSALLDRGKTYTGELGRGEKRSIEYKTPNIGQIDLLDLDLPYELSIYSYDPECRIHTLQPKGKTLVYPLVGEYIVSTSDWNNKVLRQGDALLIDENQWAKIQVLSETGHLYTVTLLPDWAEKI